MRDYRLLRSGFNAGRSRRVWYDLVMDEDLQRVQDYYVDRGLSGDKLREALEKDEKYQRLVRNRKNRLKSDLKISDDEASKFVLSTDEDYEILGKIHQLEKLNLPDEDQELVQFIRSQLVLDWRSPIIDKLDELLKKYRA
ncbi:hypothetical protein HYS97_03580 [Candidatus Daviesbacteria bacterium]|nr:hypothetical protein [Candidatus Daviesbacteria bacterium]